MSGHRSRPRRWFDNPYLDDPSQGASKVTTEWLKKEANNLLENIMSRRPEADDFHGGAYTGVGGDGYGVLRAVDIFPERKQSLVDFALHAVKSQLKASSDKRPESMARYLLGPLSLYVIKAICLKEAGKDGVKECVEVIPSLRRCVLQTGYQRNGDDEMLVGRAGYLAAILTLRKYLNEEVMSEEDLRTVLEKVIESGRTYSSKNRSPAPLMYQYHGTEYLGAAHGLMGILQMLLSFADNLDESAMRDIETTLDWLLSIQLPNGNISPDVEDANRDRGDNELVHWCHGATGAVHLFIVAYIRFKKDRFLKAAERCLDLIWLKGVLHKGPGICHGVAGSGYAFLLYYRLTKEQKYLDRARCFARIFCSEDFKSRARTPDSPYSLFEGIAGSLCFLCDLANPENAQFPLVPIPFEDN